MAFRSTDASVPANAGRVARLRTRGCLGHCHALVSASPSCFLAAQGGGAPVSNSITLALAICQIWSASASATPIGSGRLHFGDGLIEFDLGQPEVLGVNRGAFGGLFFFGLAFAFFLLPQFGALERLSESNDRIAMFLSLLVSLASHHVASESGLKLPFRAVGARCDGTALQYIEVRSKGPNDSGRCDLPR